MIPKQIESFKKNLILKYKDNEWTMSQNITSDYEAGFIQELSEDT